MSVRSFVAPCLLALAVALLACSGDEDAPTLTFTPHPSATASAVPTDAAETPTSTPEPEAGLVPLASLGLSGGRVVYSCDNGNRLCVIEMDGSSGIEFGEAATGGALSPDGALVAYFENDAGQRWLTVNTVDGGEPRRLAEARPLHNPVPPAWAPDGRTIYVEHGPGSPQGMGGDTDILAVDVETGQARLLVDTDGYDVAPAPSPDGSLVAWMHAEPSAGGGASIRVVPVGGGEVVDLTGDPNRNGAPAWLPDGRIVFMSDRSGRQQNYDLFVMDSDGSNVVNLTDSPAYDGVLAVGHFPPSVSPDGAWVGFESDRSGTTELHVVRTDASEVRQVTYGADGTAGIPSWSPDGRFLAYHAVLNAERGIYVTRIDDGATAFLTAGSLPRWSP